MGSLKIPNETPERHYLNKPPKRPAKLPDFLLYPTDIHLIKICRIIDINSPF
jgi:hypothetical protein